MLGRIASGFFKGRIQIQCLLTSGSGLSLRVGSRSSPPGFGTLASRVCSTPLVICKKEICKFGDFKPWLWSAGTQIQTHNPELWTGRAHNYRHTSQSCGQGGHTNTDTPARVADRTGTLIQVHHSELWTGRAHKYRHTTQSCGQGGHTNTGTPPRVADRAGTQIQAHHSELWTGRAHKYRHTTQSHKSTCGTQIVIGVPNSYGRKCTPGICQRINNLSTHVL